MTSPTINHRVMEFAHRFPPFNLLETDFFETVTRRARVRFFKKNEYLTEDVPFLEEHLILIKEGLLHAFASTQEEAHEWYSEGDLLTTDFLFEETPQYNQVQAVEDTLVYAFPFTSQLEDWLSQPGVAFFFGKKFSRESSVKNLFVNEVAQEGNTAEFPQTSFHLFRIKDLLPSEKRNHVAGTSVLTIREAATVMTEANRTALVITNLQHHPVGIITDSDLRRKVATGNVGLEAPVTDIMSWPVITLSPEVTFSDAQLTMMHYNMHHLCITADGTPNSPFEGFITKEEIIQLSTNHPIHLLNRMTRASSIAELKELRDSADGALKEYFQLDVATPFISGIITEINDALIKRIIQISLAEMENFPTHIPFGWISLGSEGRKEQMLRTDQDNALVYADEGASFQDVFLAFGEKVCAYLTEVGFEQCPAEIMASNPAWNTTVSGWKAHYAHWIHTPSPKEIMHSTIFFDARIVYGDETLMHSLQQFIFEEMEQQKLFIHHLAANALQNPPPQGLFRNIIVEKNGEHKDRFDLKARALMPLTDAARALIYSKRDALPTNTMERFTWLSEQEPKNRALFEEAKEAVGWLLKIRTLSGLAHHDSGRYIELDSLSRWQQRNLRQTFKLIGKLQQLINTRFRLDYLRN